MTSIQNRLFVAGACALATLGLWANPAKAAVTQAVITIDSSTTQPIGTGIVPTSASDQIIVIAEGAVRPFSSSQYVGSGWIGPDGQVRLQRGGQHVTDGMPYGCLMVDRVTAPLASFQFVGAYGEIGIAGSDVGTEIGLALNMSDSDLANIDGSLTVTLLYIPVGDVDWTPLTFSAGTDHRQGTGIIANQGDMILFLSYGAMRLLNQNYSGGWFTAAGDLSLNRGGQILSEGPYGAVLGQYGNGAAFYAGKSGGIQAFSSNDGLEVFVQPNMSVSDLASISGEFHVNVIRIPALSPADAPNGPIDSTLRVGPNPMRDQTTIAFDLAKSGDATLRVHDANGRWVRTLATGDMAAGPHEVTWDGRDESGRALGSGVYFYQLSAEGGSSTGRIVISK